MGLPAFHNLLGQHSQGKSGIWIQESVLKYFVDAIHSEMERCLMAYSIRYKSQPIKYDFQPNRNIHIVFSTPSFSEIYLQMCGVFEELDQEEEWSFLKWQSCILKFWHLELP